MNWGIIGLGNISSKFAEALTFVDDAKLYAVASNSKERASDFTKKHKAKIAYYTYNDLFKDDEVEVVYIGTPHVFHAENAIAAMNNGKAVLCEKPIAMNHKQAKKMFDCARANNVFLMEAMWTRFIPSFKKALELVENGTIGKVKNIFADFGFQTDQGPEGRLFNPKLGGGSILDVGIYPIFLALSVLGEPKNIKAFANLNAQKTDDACNMIFDYDDALANLTSSVVCNQPVSATIFGTKGTIKLNRRWHNPTSITLLKDSKEVKRFDFNEVGNGMQYQVIDVQNSIKEGRIQSHTMSWDDSLKLHKTMDLVRAEAGVSYDCD